MLFETMFFNDYYSVDAVKTYFYDGTTWTSSLTLGRL